ncbi:MAG TPA: 2Fe-2S iron-sulfur cluster-binding protein [Kofleriaceae bacterium]|nr:2Fe-2S iron-sulfur cluster-binding protein [Kofleriaceae bacterium]
MPKILFRNADGKGTEVVVEAEPGTSILHAAENGPEPEPRVGSACGGNCACSTCHVWVLEGAESLEDMDDAESDRLDLAFDVRPESRLGCQAKLADQDLVVEITPESHKAWLDEHPEVRRKLAG